MTVRRHSEDYFDAKPAAVASAARMVLARRPPYVKVCETERDAVFKAKVKPRWWLLGTDLVVHLQPSPIGTQVLAATESQAFVFGDVFNFYGRYIGEFLRDLRTEVQRQRA